MAVLIRIPAALRVVADGCPEIEVRADTVGAALAQAIARFPALRRHLYGDDGRLRSFVNVYVNEEDVRWGAGEAWRVADGDVITILPSIAGG
ncbi:MAG TPA: MoaD/ThiS family protein [Longimicrobiales bacterium]